MKNNYLIFLVLLAIISIFIYFVFSKTKTSTGETLNNPSGTESKVITPTVTPTPTPIIFDSSTNLKSELNTVNPKSEDPGFEEIKTLTNSL